MAGFIESVKLVGEREMRAAFQRRRKAVFAILDPACKRAAQLVTDAARQTSLFVDRSGALRAALRTKLRKKWRTGLRYQSGPDGRKAPHGQLVELGHKLVRHGKQVGVVQGKHMMEVAYNGVEQAAEAGIRTDVTRAVL